jgi:hypothetical protein
MNKALGARLMALENRNESEGSRLLPQVVPDTTTDAEIVLLRKNGREVFRESDPHLVDAFL